MLLEQVSNSVQKVYSFLEKLLLWSKVQRNAIALSREKVNLNHLLEESISFLSAAAAKKNITIHLICDQEVELMLDEEMISAVIRNLISILRLAVKLP